MTTTFEAIDTLIPPLTYTDLFFVSLRIAQIHRSFTDPYDLITFTTDLKVVTSYYELFTSYYNVFTAKFHDLLQVVTDKYKQLTGILRKFAVVRNSYK